MSGDSSSDNSKQDVPLNRRTVLKYGAAVESLCPRWQPELDP